MQVCDSMWNHNTLLKPLHTRSSPDILAEEEDCRYVQESEMKPKTGDKNVYWGYLQAFYLRFHPPRSFPEQRGNLPSFEVLQRKRQTSQAQAELAANPYSLEPALRCMLPESHTPTPPAALYE